MLSTLKYAEVLETSAVRTTSTTASVEEGPENIAEEATERHRSPSVEQSAVTDCLLDMTRTWQTWSHLVSTHNLSLGSKAHGLDGVGWPTSSRDPHPWHLLLEDHKYTWLYSWMLGMKLRSSVLLSKRCINWVITPAPLGWTERFWKYTQIDSSGEK